MYLLEEAGKLAVREPRVIGSPSLCFHVPPKLEFLGLNLRSLAFSALLFIGSSVSPRLQVSLCFCIYKSMGKPGFTRGGVLKFGLLLPVLSNLHSSLLFQF